MYETIHDLPIVCQLNLPEPALRLYRDAFNRAWKRAANEKGRYRLAQDAAWREVRLHFQRDAYGRWMPRAVPFSAAPADETRQRAAR